MANDTSTSLDRYNRAKLRIDTNKTLAAADSGVVQMVAADGITLTLPASASIGAGFTVVVENNGVAKTGGTTGSGDDASAGITIAMASGDGITGAGFTAAINKGAVNTKATAKVGDKIVLVASGANTAAAWNAQEVKGTWARQA
jgi:hypothetical protein